MHRVSTGVGGKGQIRVPTLAYQRVEDEGLLLPQRPIMNFTGGGVTATDDPGNNRTNVTVPLGAGINMPINPDDNNKIAYALAGNFQYTLNLRTDGTSITSVARTTVGTGAAMTVSAQDALTAGAGTNVGASLTVSAGDAANGVAANNGGDLNLTSGSGTTANGSLNLQTGNVTRMTLDPTGQQLSFASTVTNPVWQQSDRVGGAGAPIVGYPMIFRAQYVGIANPGFLNTGAALEVSSGGAINSAGSDATSGAATFKSGDVSGSGAGNDIITGHVYLTSGTATGAGGVGTATSGNVYIGAGVASGAATNTQGTVNITSTLVMATTDLYWRYDVATPTLYQQSRIAAGVGYPMVYHAQDSLITGGVNTGGSLLARGGDATANLTNNATGGNTTVRGGNATCGGGAGSVATAGSLTLASGTPSGGVTNTYAAVLIANGDRNVAQFSSDATNTYWTHPRSTTVQMNWTIAFTGNKTTAGAAGSLSVYAQGVSGAVAATGGALTIYAGDNVCTSGAESGGAATFRGGDVSGASGGANTGGNVIVRPGGAANGGTNYVGNTYIGGDGATPLGTVDATHGVTYFYMGTTAVASYNLVGGVVRLTWAAGLSNCYYEYATKTGGVGGGLTIGGQPVSAGGGVNTGGALTISAGGASGAASTATGGSYTANGGDVSGAFTVAGVGGATILRGGNVTNVAAKTSTGGKATLAGGDCTGVAAGATAQAGHALIRGGVATGATINYQGNVGIHSDPASWQSGEKVMWFGVATTVPTGGSASGFFVYMDPGTGKLCCMSPAGTVTEFGAA